MHSVLVGLAIVEPSSNKDAFWGNAPDAVQTWRAFEGLKHARRFLHLFVRLPVQLVQSFASFIRLQQLLLHQGKGCRFEEKLRVWDASGAWLLGMALLERSLWSKLGQLWDLETWHHFQNVASCFFRKSRESESAFDAMQTVLEQGGHFAGVNRKVQLKPMRWEAGAQPGSKGTRITEALLILKHGGVLTHAGRQQVRARPLQGYPLHASAHLCLSSELQTLLYPQECHSRSLVAHQCAIATLKSVMIFGSFWHSSLLLVSQEMSHITACASIPPMGVEWASLACLLFHVCVAAITFGFQVGLGCKLCGLGQL